VQKERKGGEEEMNFIEAYVEVLSKIFDIIDKWLDEWIERNY